MNINIADIDEKLIIASFTHPSYKGMYPNVEDYERLEFLGDSVLDLIAAEELVRKENISEGAMTERRKMIVNNDYLSQIFEELDFMPIILAAMHYQPSTKDKANFVEAFFGALFLSLRYEKCLNVWDLIQEKMMRYKEQEIQEIEAKLSPVERANKAKLQQHFSNLGLRRKNAKNMLQELCQKQGLPIPQYELIDRIGPDHSPVFRVKITAEIFDGASGKLFDAIGEARSKKTAEIKAAEKLCDKIYLDYISID